MATVDPRQISDLFDTIAPRYDQLNDLLSLGLHRLWKRQALLWLAPRPGQRLLDLAARRELKRLEKRLQETTTPAA